MSVLKEMKAGTSQQINALSARQSAINLIEWTGQQLRVMGFGADFSGDAKDVVTLHCSLVSKERAVHASANPAPMPALKSVARSVKKKATAPLAQSQDQPAGLITGKYSEAEFAIINKMLDDHATNAQIAAELGRDARLVSSRLATVRRQRREAAGGGKETRPPAQARKVEPAPFKPTRTKVSAAKPAPAASAAPAAPAKPEPKLPSAKLSTRSHGGAVPFDTETSHADRVLGAHLNALGYAGGWSAIRDLDLIQSLTRGMPVAMVADNLGVESGDVVRRFKALNARPGDLDHQSRLIRMLKARSAGGADDGGL